MQKYCAIDIGSNAVRLTLATVLEGPKGPRFNRDFNLRLPVRLGSDVFTDGVISKANKQKLIHVMRSFKEIIDGFRPKDVMACATSAMRDAKNGDELSWHIREEVGIPLEIIDGKREAEIIFSNHIENMLDRSKTYLYIDVGGGSTELTLLKKGEALASRSFNLGTVRILSGAVEPGEWDRLHEWISESIPTKKVIGIGSGGNIGKYHDLSRVKSNKSLHYDKLEEIYLNLKNQSYDERMYHWHLKPDRADVIVPAGEIYLQVMKWAQIKQIYAPKLGLADGMIHLLYDKHTPKKGRA